MALSDSKLRTLKATDKVYSKSDGGGLYIEVLPTGKKRWGLKYRTVTGKQETIRLGDYPTYALAEARSGAMIVRLWPVAASPRWP